MRVIPVRLEPGTDLAEALHELVRAENLGAAWVMTCVGSLRRIALRLADIRVSHGDFEVVSAAGTLSQAGCHVHIVVADGDGGLIGGHLAHGCVVAEDATVELVIGADDGWRFGRGKHPRTGYDELTIEPA